MINKGSVLKKIYSCMINPSYRGKTMYYLAKKAQKKGVRFVPQLIHHKLVKDYGCFLSLNSRIHESTDFKHFNGIIIGDGVVVEKNVVIYHQVTIGGKEIGDAHKNNYPRIEEGVTLFAGSKILGGVKVGKNSIVGANSVVIKDVPENVTVAGTPARIVKHHG